MKYLVLECHPAFAVVLGEDGSFLRVANLRYEVGQTVTDVQPMKAKKPHRSIAKTVYGAVACVACLCLLMGSLWFTRFATYASVYVSINPQVRIDVNRKDDVIELFGINEDGKALMKDYSYDQKPLEKVMDDLLIRAIEQGYLVSGGDVTLTLDANEHWIEQHETPLQTHVDSYLDSLVKVTITVVPMTETVPLATDAPPMVRPTNGDSNYNVSDYGSGKASSVPTPSTTAAPGLSGDSGYNDYDNGNSDYDDENGNSDYDN